ncbi:MAG: hypothetical protein J7L15_08190 [Clostridiales bacterium]|nr:hypothetical protein [Clostridiales bacterium]
MNNKVKQVKRNPKLDKYISGEVVLFSCFTYDWHCSICDEHNIEIGYYGPQYVSCSGCLKRFRYTYAGKENG